jgi:ATP-dependent Zn protease
MNSDEPTPKNLKRKLGEAAIAKLIATAFHEAGHAVMALALGRPVQKVTISPAQLQSGGYRLGACQFDKGRTKASKDWIEDEVLILLAGMVAESHVTSEYCQHGAAQDLRVARRLLENRAKNERQLERLERRMLDKTNHLLSDEAMTKAVELIANELLERETVSGRAVRHFFQQAMQQFES